MGSVLLWQTDLGLLTIGSGELSPGLSCIELRFSPPYGLGKQEWELEVGVLKGQNPFETIYIDHYVPKEKYFLIKAFFKSFKESCQIQLYAKHLKTQTKLVIWEGVLVPNMLTVENTSVGLSYNWNVHDDIKDKYPHLDLRHFKIPKIQVKVGGSSIIMAKATCEDMYTPDNTPVIFKGFHPEQEFSLEIVGHVLGYGGKGGDAGMSTVTDEVDIVYPTDAKDGGDCVYIEHPTQAVDIVVDNNATYQPGQGGKGASSFLVDSPSKRMYQLGTAGVGGYPNGLNGSFTDIHYRTKAVRKSMHPEIALINGKDYLFKPAKVEGQVLPIFPSNKSVPASRDGKVGKLMPTGVRSLKNHGRSFELTNLSFVFGRYLNI